MLNSRHAGYSSLISNKFTPMLVNKCACAVSYKKQISFNIQASISHIFLTTAPKRGTGSCQNSNSVVHCICILFCNLDCLRQLPIIPRRMQIWNSLSHFHNLPNENLSLTELFAFFMMLHSPAPRGAAGTFTKAQELFQSQGKGCKKQKGILVRRTIRMDRISCCGFCCFFLFHVFIYLPAIFSLQQKNAIISLTRNVVLPV